VSFTRKLGLAERSCSGRGLDQGAVLLAQDRAGSTDRNKPDQDGSGTHFHGVELTPFLTQSAGFGRVLDTLLVKGFRSGVAAMSENTLPCQHRMSTVPGVSRPAFPRIASPSSEAFPPDEAQQGTLLTPRADLLCHTPLSE
jgi:hypothetical protein